MLFFRPARKKGFSPLLNRHDHLFFNVSALDLLRNYVRYEIFKFDLRRSKNYEAYTAYMLNNFCKAAAQIWESQ